MTYEAAKALFEQDLKDGKCSDGCPECNARELAISALEKQIPKKVNISIKGTTDWNIKCNCPNCHSMVFRGKYCSNCGQALYWRDT